MEKDFCAGDFLEELLASPAPESKVNRLDVWYKSEYYMSRDEKSIRRAIAMGREQACHTTAFQWSADHYERDCNRGKRAGEKYLNR